MKNSFTVFFSTCLSILILSKSTTFSQDYAPSFNGANQYIVHAVDKDVNYLLSELPALSKTVVNGIYFNAADCSASITYLGVPNPTQHGFCWGPSNPTILNNKNELGPATSTGEFSAMIANLTSITSYYVRAYATNDAGTSYGEQVYFTTSPHGPSSLTLTCSDVTDNSARVVINMSMVDCYDCCYLSPSYWASWYVDGELHTAVGGSVLITGLHANTPYTVYGHVICYWGETYDLGSVSFTTLSELPVEIISFTATKENNNVMLKWQTATEVNNYGFEIERAMIYDKLEMTNFEKVGFVEGSGNSNSSKSYSFENKNPPCGKLHYRLKQIDFDGNYEYKDEIEITIDLPTQFTLEQNFPNPFNPSTIIRYSIPNSGKVLLKVYNVLGKEVTTLVNEFKYAGNFEIEFNASELTSGVYFYKIISGSNSETRKMMLIK